MKREHKHNKLFRVLRFMKVCGDHISDENTCVYDIYLNPYNPLSWFFAIIQFGIAVLLNGIISIPEAYKETVNLFKNYYKT